MSSRLRAVLLGSALCVVSTSVAAGEHAGAGVSSPPRPPGAEFRGDLLALFLTRLAQAAADGDAGRVTAFLDEVSGVEFYMRYGLSRFNERVADVAYRRYLAAYAEGKPRLVAAMTKSSLVIATGTALPMIVEGRFEGRAFAVSAASLGISTAAMKTGAAALDWVKDLDEATHDGTLARFGAKAGRVAKLNGWFYQVAEQAVIIYFTERIEPEIRRALDEREWRAELASEIEAFLRRVADEVSTDETLAAYHEAWIRYRNRFYEAVEIHEHRFDECLARVARRAKIVADARRAMIEKVPNARALHERLRARYGSLESYAEHLLGPDKERIDESFAACVERYNAARDEVLTEIYEERRRNTPLLAGVGKRDRLLAGALAGEVDDALADALKRVSPNRIESYGDETEILGGVARALRRRGLDAAASTVEDEIETVRRLEALDRRLYRGSGLLETRP